MSLKKAVFGAVLALAVVTVLPAQIIPEHVPEIMAESACVIEINTGRVLYSKNPDAVRPPASLTKLMTLHIVYTFIENGRISSDDLVPVSAAADWHALPKGSSLMFIESGQLVTVRELMQGLAVSSGNDAAVALAEYVAGSVDEFIMLMNKEAQNLGFDSMEFHDASGLSAANTISARQFAEFCSLYVRQHAAVLSDLHSLTSFTYPKRHNVPSGSEPYRWEIKQFNRNHLLGRMEGITGLKTGYIDESLFNVAISGTMNGMDIVAVILGTPGDLDKSGYMNRTLDSAVLMSWVFNNFSAVNPAAPLPESITVWYGKEEAVALTCDPPQLIILSDNERAEYYGLLEIPDSVNAPVKEGQEIGTWSAWSGNKMLVSVPVRAAAAVKKSKPLGVFGDWVKKLFK